MRGRAPSGNHGRMTAVLDTAAPASRRLYRRPDQGIFGGVATGIAEHIGMSTKWVRIAFVCMAVSGGLGIALYGAYLIVLPPAPHAGPSRFPSWVEYLAAGIAAAVAIGVAAKSLPTT